MGFGSRSGKPNSTARFHPEISSVTSQCVGEVWNTPFVREPLVLAILWHYGANQGFRQKFYVAFQVFIGVKESSIGAAQSAVGKESPSRGVGDCRNVFLHDAGFVAAFHRDAAIWRSDEHIEPVGASFA